MIEPQGHGKKLVDAVGRGAGIYHAINFETTTLNVLDVVHASLVRQVAHVKSLLEVLIRATVERSFEGNVQVETKPQKAGKTR